MASPSRNTRNSAPTSFLGDVVKSTPLVVTKHHYDVLGKNNFVQTTMADYLLQRFCIDDLYSPSCHYPGSEILGLINQLLEKLKLQEETVNFKRRSINLSKKYKIFCYERFYDSWFFLSEFTFYCFKNRSTWYRK